MHLLRERLKTLNPELYYSLERSWDIAHEQWLPALAASKSSYNSYPHLRNVERFLDQIVEGFEQHPGSRTALSLNPTEIYVLLVSVLLHDIGRVREKSTGPKHGQLTEEMVKDDWAPLGLPSEAMGASVGRICGFHQLNDGETYEQVAKYLSTSVIDPYKDEIRELPLACLLTLADHLDGSQWRVVPPYIKDLAEMDAIGAFRKVITGVHIDPDTRMIRTVVNSELGKHKPEGDTEPVYNFNREREPEAQSWGLVEAQAKAKRLSGPKNEDFLRCDTLLELLDVHKDSIDPRIKESKPLTASVAECGEFDRIQHLVARQLLLVKNPSDDANAKWSPLLLLAIVLGNLRENIEAIKDIQGYLASAGVPIRAWVIQHGDRLFNQYGEETYEPVFDVDYLLDVADHMWDISTRIFGTAEISYSDLAAHLRESDENRVAAAVRRIAAATKGPDNSVAVWWCDSTWKWNVTVKGDICDYVPLKTVKDRINELKEPL